MHRAGRLVELHRIHRAGRLMELHRYRLRGITAEMRENMIQKSIRELVRYGLATGLVEPEDTIYTANRLLELFGLEELEDADTPITADKSEEAQANWKAFLRICLTTRHRTDFLKTIALYTGICSIQKS
jgi:hypothetical protein